MASDFFYPNTGGVEAHILQLGQCLVKLGHKVIVITHAYGDLIGIRHMENGIKVHYLPIVLVPKQNIIWPLVFHTLTTIRQILIEERINIVHGHSVYSPLAHEVMFHAKSLGINTAFTDHSLFGLDDIGARIHKYFVRLSLLQCNQIICVSNVGIEALRLQTNQDETIPISVIPNAVDTDVFKPDPSQRDPNKITIIVNSRLVYRKGIDLLAHVIPKVCRSNYKVRFIISGDGPNRKLLEDAVTQHSLQNQVSLLGSVPHDQVRDVLVKGDIFLNTSVIEAFCMAVLEAASCGLQVVSTNVGGLPSVLPQELRKLTEPHVESICSGVQQAMDDLAADKFVCPFEAHQIIRNRYSWQDVARQTELVYKSILAQPPTTLKERVRVYMRSQSQQNFMKVILKYVFILFMLINHSLSITLDWLYPRKNIDICPTSRDSNHSASTKTKKLSHNLSQSQNIIYGTKNI